jgi:drug/metabolite transporter (DMT)-like permease
VVIEAWKTAKTTTNEEDSTSSTTIGMTLVIIQTCAMANVVVFQKSILARYEPTVVTFVFYGIGTLFTILLCICWESHFENAADFLFHSELLPWLALGYATIFATLFSYNAISFSGKRLSPSITTVYCTFQPVGTVILSFLLLDATLTLSEGVGGACVICGLIITVIGRQWEIAEKGEIEIDNDNNHSINVSNEEEGDIGNDVDNNTGGGSYHILDEENSSVAITNPIPTGK